MKKTGLLRINPGKGNSNGDVIFVHGLMGHRIKTWHPHEEDNKECWPYWLAEESLFQNVGIWSFGYEAEASKWFGSSQPLFDQGRNLLDNLESEELGQQPLMFITHSLGGLVVKEMLHSAENYPNIPRKRAIIQNTKGIVFLATPHLGSDLSRNTVLKIMSLLLSVTISVKELESNSNQLRSLDEWYKQYINNNNKRISTKVYYETKEIQGIGIVVDSDSADPKIPDVQPMPINADHITIAKPTSTEDRLYKNVKLFIHDCLPLTATKQLPPSSENPIELSQKKPGVITENPISALLNTNSISEGRDKIWDSMVKILDPTGNTVGSGFIIHSDGYFVTCHHIISSLNLLSVQHQGKNYQAKWQEKFSNLEVDIAILKIDVKNAKPISITIPKDQMVSALVYGFSDTQEPRFSKSFDVYDTLKENIELNTISIYKNREEISCIKPWHKKPQNKSTFRAYKIQRGDNEEIYKGVFGGLVLDQDSNCAIGVLQSSDNKESYVIGWENIIDCLKQLKIDPEQQEVYSTVTRKLELCSKSEPSSDIYIPDPGYLRLLGRESELQNIREVLSDNVKIRIVGVSGMGGVGKTSLAREIIKSYSDIGFSKVVWQTAPTNTKEASSPMTFETIIDSIIKQLNRDELCKEVNQEKKMRELREQLQETPVLIVLDNMETSAEPQDKIIQKLLPILGSSKGLLTSRHKFIDSFENNVYPFNLSGLNKEAAINLLKDIATHKDLLKDFNAYKNYELEEMIDAIGDEKFGYIPYALGFMLGQLRMHTARFIIDSFKDSVHSINIDSGINEKDEYKFFWKKIFLTSLKSLSILDQKFMSGMLHFEPNIGSQDSLIMSFMGFSLEQFRQVVNSTWKVSFLEISEGGPEKTYYLHRLSYEFFRGVKDFLGSNHK
jgi:hypothetical protein